MPILSNLRLSSLFFQSKLSNVSRRKMSFLGKIAPLETVGGGTSMSKTDTSNDSSSKRGSYGYLTPLDDHSTVDYRNRNGFIERIIPTTEINSIHQYDFKNNLQNESMENIYGGGGGELNDIRKLSNENYTYSSQITPPLNEDVKHADFPHVVPSSQSDRNKNIIISKSNSPSNLPPSNEINQHAIKVGVLEKTKVRSNSFLNFSDELSDTESVLSRQSSSKSSSFDIQNDSNLSANGNKSITGGNHNDTLSLITTNVDAIGLPSVNVPNEVSLSSKDSLLPAITTNLKIPLGSNLPYHQGVKGVTNVNLIPKNISISHDLTAGIALLSKTLRSSSISVSSKEAESPKSSNDSKKRNHSIQTITNPSLNVVNSVVGRINDDNGVVGDVLINGISKHTINQNMNRIDVSTAKRRQSLII